MLPSIWDLEPRFGPDLHGYPVSVVLNTLIYQPGKHLCYSEIHKQNVFTNCVFQRGAQSHTILEGLFQVHDGQFWILMTQDTRTFPRAPLAMQGLYNIVDACSGIAAVTKGFEAAGASVLCHVESNPNFHAWTHHQSSVPSIRGDVSDPQTIYEVSRVVQESHVVSAGISCQPFSALGDQRQGLDPRSKSFTGVMILGYFMGCLAYLLECTKEALESEWIQRQLEAFTRQTGYQVSQTLLDLHRTWPARRTRWWAVIAHPVFGQFRIPAMPSMRFEPSIIHLLKDMLQIPDDQMEQLALSVYELRQFYAARGGIGPNVIDTLKAMSTATHSWGSQVVGCACECRKNGFSQERIDMKGLYAVLIPIPGKEFFDSQSFQKMRHPHPQEVALLNGLSPTYVKPHPNRALRLDLAGVGQLASPLQGAWILASFIRHAVKLGLHANDMNPVHVHADMCRALLEERNEWWPLQGFTKPMKLFHQEVEALDRPLVFQVVDDFHSDHPVGEKPTESAIDHEVQNLPGLHHANGVVSGPSETVEALFHSDAEDSKEPVIAQHDQIQSSLHRTNGVVAEPSGTVGETTGDGATGTISSTIPTFHTDDGSVGVKAPNQIGSLLSDEHVEDHVKANETKVAEERRIEVHEPTHDPRQSPFQAKPLPRLGCGGPSHGVIPNEPEESEHGDDHSPRAMGADPHNESSDPHATATNFGDEANLTLHCQFDPYQSVVSSQDSLPGSETFETEKLMLSPNKDHGVDFYEDPHFDQAILATDDTSTPANPDTTGAVPGFATKRSFVGVLPMPKKPCVEVSEAAGSDSVPTHLTSVEDCEEDENTNEYHGESPPTRFQAKPLPRLGCGGPSQNEPPEDPQSSDKYQPGSLSPSAIAADHVSLPKPNQATAPWDHGHPDIQAEDSKPEDSVSIRPAVDATTCMGLGSESCDASVHEGPANGKTDLCSPVFPGNGNSTEVCIGKGQNTPVANDNTLLDEKQEPRTRQERMQAIEIQIARTDRPTLFAPASAEATVQDLCLGHMECCLEPVQVVTDILGHQLDSQQLLAEHRTYVMRQALDRSSTGVPPTLCNGSRESLLFQQGGWVALDEMHYYLYMLECYNPTTTVGILPLHDHMDQSGTLTDFVLKVINMTANEDNSPTKAFVVLRNRHWIPIVVRTCGQEVHIVTPTCSRSWIQSLIEEVVEPGNFHFSDSVMPNAFANDCGFQAVGWLLSILLQDDTNVPFSCAQAIQWRELFLRDLYNTGKAFDQVLMPLQLGGTQALRDQLCSLVVSHGVAQTRGKECADQLINSMGHLSIQQILSSPRPWSDLKARANLQKPAIRIVLAEELQQLIQAKSNGNQVGSKTNKIKTKVTKKQPLQISASQLEIPSGVFKQSDGSELSQINASQIAAGCQGVAIANIQEVLPYFSLTEPVSQAGVALLVIEHDDPRLPQNCQIMKVPAQCKETKEPLIIKVAIIQLGHLVVSRNIPAQALVVPETSNQVIRAFVYKDQYGGNWQEFIQSPVKTLMKQHPFDTVPQSDVIDVWDRQYLTSKMTKSNSEDAVIFCVNIRLNLAAKAGILAANGSQGMYIEPRTADGRQPDESQKVVWLPKKSFGEAQVCQQTSKIPTMLARHCDRYGLRVAAQQAEELHKTYRPDLVYIPGAELTKYRVGPMPFGTTKQSLVHVFAKWGWQARPLAPQGQAQDRSGVMWIAQAAEPPTHWIFHLSHGDVLVSPEHKGPVAPEQTQGVLASTKTIQALQMRPMQATTEDPWIHSDPWQSTRPTGRELSTGQVMAMESRIQQSVLTKIRSEDADMGQPSDDRVTALEARLDQLSHTVAIHQQESVQQHQVVQNQLCALDQKVDSQQTVFQNTLESKLEQQMQRIEQLFTKRQRCNE